MDKKTKGLLIISIIVVVAVVGAIVYASVVGNITSSTSDVNVDVNIEDITYSSTDVDYTAVLNSGNVVEYNEIININQSGTYIFEGEYKGTTINIDTPSGDVYIVLNECNITGNEESVINIIQAGSVTITVSEGTINNINQTYTSSSIEKSGAAIYSKEDLLITGTGKLYIDTVHNDGINGRDDVIIENTKIYIVAQADGIKGNDNLIISNSYINVESGEDGLKSSNDTDSAMGNILIESGTYIINSVQDGISAEGTLQINDGTFEITTNGGFVEVTKEITLGEGSGGYVQTNESDYSAKCLKALDIKINGGEFILSSTEDAVHANNDMYITGGDFEIICEDDGIHADNYLVIDDIELVMTEGYEGIEASSITINGGTIDVSVLDDAINASDEILIINGGTIIIYSRGDGIDSNGDLLITGGTITIESDAIYSGGDSAIDVSGTITVTGGTIIDENGDDIDYDLVMNTRPNMQTNNGNKRR